MITVNKTVSHPYWMGHMFKFIHLIKMTSLSGIVTRLIRLLRMRMSEVYVNQWEITKLYLTVSFIYNVNDSAYLS